MNSLLLGLDGGGNAVEGTLDVVGGLLEVCLLRVGLDGGSGLVGEGLSTLQDEAGQRHRSG